MEPSIHQKLLNELEKLRGERIRTFNLDEISWTEISDKSSLTDYPLVSVQMITYNHEPYIDQAIEGVLFQETDFSIELVIGEDCSTDRTREIVMKYQNKHPDIIRVITSDHNVGARKNSQRTIKACRGKYIAFCEGDDYWHDPNKLQIQYDYLEKHPEFGLVHTDYDVFDQRRSIFRHDVFNDRNRSFDFDSSPMDTFLAILDQQYFPRTCTVMVVKRLLDQIISSDAELYRSNRFLMGDLQIWGEMALISRVHYIDLSKATYRVLPDSAARPKNLRRAAEFKLSVADLRIYLSAKHGCERHVVQKYWDWFLRGALWYGVLSRNAGMIQIAVAELPNLSIKERFLSFGRYGWPVVHALCYVAKVIAMARSFVERVSNGYLALIKSSRRQIRLM
jgi:glycosyltransferase involved in cell wall biosynthesis